MAAGHAVRQALTLSFSKGGEERRTCVAVISIQRKSEKQLSSKASAAFRLPAITSVRSLVFPAQAVIPRSPEPVVSQQAVPSSRSSPDLSGLLAKSPCEGDCEWRPIEVVSSSNIPDVGIDERNRPAAQRLESIE